MSRESLERVIEAGKRLHNAVSQLEAELENFRKLVQDDSTSDAQLEIHRQRMMDQFEGVLDRYLELRKA